MGEGFSYDEPEIPEFTELICATHNETSTGVQMREPDIQRLKRSNYGRLLAVDMVSSAPIPDLDYNLIDTAFFSVQKAFGMPAGLGVWIANEACLEKSLKIKASEKENLHIGAHHDLPTLWEMSKKFQTPSTPNVLWIYILGKIAEDMNEIGVENIRKETDAKAKMIYDFLEESVLLHPSVKHVPHRSRTVAVANSVIDSSIIMDKLKAKNMIIGAGYGPNKNSQIRIANFPATSMEKTEQLIEALRQLEP
jgi:phosphoserine aminotransferase